MDDMYYDENNRSRMQVHEKRELLHKLNIHYDSPLADEALKSTEENLKMMEESGLDAHLFAWGLRYLADYSNDMMEEMINIQTRDDAFSAFLYWLDKKEAEVHQSVETIVDEWMATSEFEMYSLFGRLCDEIEIKDIPQFNQVAFKKWKEIMTDWESKTRKRLENTTSA